MTRTPPRFAVALALVVLGCGGATLPGSPATGDGGSSSPSTACPGALPSPGSPCTTTVPSCEFGNDPSPACDTLMTCSAGVWTVTQGPATDGCSTTNPPACPATFADITQGEACGDAGASCYYPDARCDCQVVVLEGACVPSECPAPTWRCDTAAVIYDGAAEPGCPASRPRIGSGCGVDGMKCDYEPCGGDVSGVSMACMGGDWQAVEAFCPR